MKAVKDLVLHNGCNPEDQTRTIMSVTGLPANTLVEYIGRETRWKGTGYNNSLYRIVDTDDLLTIRHNDGPIDNVYWENVVITQGYFTKQRQYGQQVGKLAHKYHLPFELCLALGTDEDIYPWFLSAMSDLGHVTIGSIRDLYAGINRRKDGLLQVLGEDLYCAIGIGSMGQQNSTRIATYVANHCYGWLNR